MGAFENLKNRPGFRWKLPEFHLKLTPSAGSYATNPRWSNKDLDPVPVIYRTWGVWDFFNYWCSDMLAPPLWSTISAVMSIGFTARQAIPICFFGFLICGGVIGLTARIGAMYHTPFPVVARVSFGMWGCIPAILVRTFVALMWTAITTVQGGGYLQNMVTAIWPSYNNFPNKLPASANITSGALLMVFLYWIVQTAVSCLPMYRLRYFFRFKAIVVPPAFMALFLWGAIVTHGGGPLVSGPIILTTGLNTGWSAMRALNVIIGLFSSLAVNMPDFGRFSKYENAGYSQFVFLPLLGTLGALAPIFVTSAAEYLWGEYIWFMPAVIAKFDSRAAMFFTGFAMAIATMGNQIAAGSYPFGNDISALAPRYVNIRRAALFMAVFCIASNPWTIIVKATQLLAFLSGYSCFMGPIAGILVSDFYLIRDKKLDVRDMYNPNGIYRYWRGWNWRAWLTFSIAVGPIMPGFANSINPNINISDGAKELYCIAWMWGFSSCVIVYYVINKYISPPPNLIDEPYFPPHTLEEEEAQRNGQLDAYRAGTYIPSPDSGSIEKVQETVQTKLVEEQV